jgi:hypothetical protein
MCGRGVKCPRCPAAVKGTKTQKSHCHERNMMGRRVSRLPEAGKPVHRSSSRGECHVDIIFHTFPNSNLPACYFRLQGCKRSYHISAPV